MEILIVMFGWILILIATDLKRNKECEIRLFSGYGLLRLVLLLAGVLIIISANL